MGEERKHSVVDEVGLDVPKARNCWIMSLSPNERDKSKCTKIPFPHVSKKVAEGNTD